VKQLPIEITNEQVSQELDMWFNNEECAAVSQAGAWETEERLMLPLSLHHACNPGKVPVL
jgi:hypothetical protein